MDFWGNEMFVTPGVVVDGELVTTNLVDINLGIRILLGSSYYEDWENEETFVEKDPLGNPVDKRHPWNQTTIPKPQKRDLDGGNYSWVMSPRWYDKRTGDYLALDTGGGALARLWVTALANKVDTPYVKATGNSVKMNLPKTPNTPEMDLEWKVPQWSNAIERDRARIYFVAYAAGMAFHFLDQAFNEIKSGNTKVFEDFDVPDEAIGCGFHEAVRGVLSHHLVIRDGKIANYHPYPPTPWNGNPTDSYGTPGPYEDAVMGQPIFEENGQDDFRGIDIMRAVRSFDPCLPCGVHMYLGKGKTLQEGALADVRRALVTWTTGRRANGSSGSRLLLEQVEALPDPDARDIATELVQALLDLYGEALARMMEHVPDAEALADDELISHLLMLHGIHPVPLEARVRGALGRGPSVPGLARRERGARVGRGRRRAPADGGQLQRLPLVHHDAEARDRGRDPQGRAGRRWSIEAEGATAPAPSPGLIQLTPLEPAATGARRTASGRRSGSCATCTDGGDAAEDRRGRAGAVPRPDGQHLRLPAGLPGVRPLARARASCGPRSCVPRLRAPLRRDPRGPVRRRPRCSTSSRCRCSSTTPGS